MQLAEIKFPKDGASYRQVYDYHETIKGAVSSITTVDGDNRILARRTFEYQPASGLVTGKRQTAVDVASGRSEVTEGFALARESAAPFRPTRIEDLVAKTSVALSYSNNKVALTELDQNGTQVRKSEYEVKPDGSSRITGVEDLVTQTPKLNYNYDPASGMLKDVLRSAAGSLSFQASDSDGVNKITEVDDIGVRTVVSLNPKNGRVLSRQYVYPNGSSKTVNYQYQEDASGNVLETTRTITYPNGMKVVRRD